MRRKPFFGESRMRVYEDFSRKSATFSRAASNFVRKPSSMFSRQGFGCGAENRLCRNRKGVPKSGSTSRSGIRSCIQSCPRHETAQSGYGKMSVPEAIICQLRGYPPGQGARSTVLCYYAASSSCDIRAFASLPEHTHSP